LKSTPALALPWNLKRILFFDVEAWDKAAELISEYFSKGSPIHLVGRLKQDRWQDDNGNQRSRVKVVVQSIQFLPRGDSGSGNSNKGGSDNKIHNDNSAPF